MKSLYDQISSPYNRAKTMLPKLTSKSAAESSRQMNHRYCGGRSCRCLYDVKRLRCKMAKLDQIDLSGGYSHGTPQKYNHQQLYSYTFKS
jgi:hypothetical protein